MFETGYAPRKRYKKSSTRDWFQTIVKRALTGDMRTRLQERLYPSSASICSRRNYLATRVQTTSNMSAAGTLYTTVGQAVHEAIQEGLMRDGQALLIEPAYKIPEWNFSGKIDVISLDPYTRKLFIVDIKTTGDIPRAVPDSYKGQLASYALASGIPAIELLYVSRNIQNPPKMRMFTVELDSPLLLKTAYVYAETMVANKHDVCPARLDKKGKCTFCPYIGMCWNDDPGLDNFHHLLTEEQEEEAYEVAHQLIEGMPDRLEQTYARILALPNLLPEVRDVLEQ